MNMIEKMARAIYGTWAAHEGVETTWEEIVSIVSEPTEDREIHEIHKLVIMEAKAALECLKEQTQGMLDARLYGLNHDVEYEQRKDLRPAIFKAMINAALEGK